MKRYPAFSPQRLLLPLYFASAQCIDISYPHFSLPHSEWIWLYYWFHYIENKSGRLGIIGTHFSFLWICHCIDKRSIKFIYLYKFIIMPYGNIEVPLLLREMMGHLWVILAHSSSLVEWQSSVSGTMPHMAPISLGLLTIHFRQSGLLGNLRFTWAHWFLISLPYNAGPNATCIDHQLEETILNHMMCCHWKRPPRAPGLQDFSAPLNAAR